MSAFAVFESDVYLPVIVGHLQRLVGLHPDAQGLSVDLACDLEQDDVRGVLDEACLVRRSCT